MRFDGERFAVDGFAAETGARGIAGLEDEVGDETVEEEVVVEAFEGEGEEVSAGERGFVGEEGDGDGAFGGDEVDEPGGGWFGDVLRGHGWSRGCALRRDSDEGRGSGGRMERYEEDKEPKVTLFSFCFRLHIHGSRSNLQDAHANSTRFDLT